MADEVLERVRTELKDSLTDSVIKQLLDDLNDEKVLGDEEVESILQQNPLQADRARCLIGSVKKKGPKACQILLEKLQKRDKYVYDKLQLDDLPPLLVPGVEEVTARVPVPRARLVPAVAPRSSPVPQKAATASSPVSSVSTDLPPGSQASCSLPVPPWPVSPVPRMPSVIVSPVTSVPVLPAHFPGFVYVPVHTSMPVCLSVLKPVTLPCGMEITLPVPVPTAGPFDAGSCADESSEWCPEMVPDWPRKRWWKNQHCVPSPQGQHT
ncbi:protein diaphanous homolog 1-like [Electrophorus electricus]|uniref:protein diaphanous homolog 1-like n=1 Tax=Electrophorus electricus TaxID=8005 RepID=UPI0015CFCEA9|nr:protein diaphanous homolog 1-like [Electrophorus electricus]